MNHLIVMGSGGAGSASSERIARVEVLLALFSTEQLYDIVAVVQNHGTTIIPSATRRKEANLPPAMMSFLAGKDHAYSAQHTKELLWGYCTMVYASLRKSGKDKEYYKQLIMDAFGINEKYATSIAEKIDTPDSIKGIGNLALDSLRKLVNISLPESWDIKQADKWDIDSGYEMMLLGRELISLAERESMKVGALSHFINAGMMFNFGTAETGDVEMGDYEAGEILDLINSAANPVGDIGEIGGPFGSLLRLGRNALKSIPPEVLTAATTRAAKTKSSRGSRKALRTAAPKSPRTEAKPSPRKRPSLPPPEEDFDDDINLDLFMPEDVDEGFFAREEPED